MSEYSKPEVSEEIIDVSEEIRKEALNEAATLIWRYMHLFRTGNDLVDGNLYGSVLSMIHVLQACAGGQDTSSGDFTKSAKKVLDSDSFPPIPSFKETVTSMLNRPNQAKDFLKN